MTETPELAVRIAQEAAYIAAANAAAGSPDRRAACKHLDDIANAVASGELEAA